MSLTLTLGLINLFAATLGVFISIWTPHGTRLRIACVASFVLLGIAGLVVAHFQDRDDKGFKVGGDFGYCLYDAFSQKMQFVNPGPYPLYNMNASFFDLTRFNEDKGNGTQKPLASYASVVSLPDTYKQNFITIPVVLGNRSQQDFNIQFTEARNGSTWIEEMRFRVVDGVWVSAIRVPHKSFELIDPRFPRDASGRVDWQ